MSINPGRAHSRVRDGSLKPLVRHRGRLLEPNTLIYGPLSVVFLILVLQLQTVAGFSPVAAGTALLPLTVTGPHPLVPPALFANPVFSAASAATLLIYGPLSVVFLILA